LKFKYLIIIFSVIIVVIVLTTSLLPLLISGHGNAVTFRYITLPLLLFMAVLLICMSIFFFINYRLFSLLEREDWPALAYYLEQKIYTKGRYTDRYVRLLASSYLVISDFSAVLKLENKILTAKPSLISKNVLIFGAARVLSGGHHEAVLFFKNYLEKCGQNDKQWVRWFYGFSQILSGNFRQAEPEFTSLTVTSDSILITGLSAYFLKNTIEKHSLDPQKCHEAAENGRERVRNALNSSENWQKEKEKMRAEIHIAIISKYINEAGKWIFNKDSADPPLYADLPVTNDNSEKYK
jgi:ABC-type multidrug transport system fused ATPase/permease subunit